MLLAQSNRITSTTTTKKKFAVKCLSQRHNTEATTPAVDRNLRRDFTLSFDTNNFVCDLNFFSSPPLCLWHRPRHSSLSSVFLFPPNSLVDLTETVFFLLLYCQTAMDPWTLISPGNDATDDLAGRGPLLLLSAISCSLSL